MSQTHTHKNVLHALMERCGRIRQCTTERLPGAVSRMSRLAGIASSLCLATAAYSQSTPDTTAPTITKIELDLASATPTTARFVVTFDEPVAGVDATDFAINGTLTATANITSVSPGATAATYYVNFGYTGTNGSLQLGVKTSGTGIADLASNAFTGGGVTASPPYPVNNAGPADMTLPTVASFTAPSGTLTSPVNLSLVFSEPVTGVSADDFIVPAGVTIGAVSGSGTTWTVPVVFTGTTPITVRLVGGATANIRDVATHWFAGGSAATATFTPGTSGGGTPAAAPVISSPLTASVKAGTAFTYTLTATNTPTSLTATGLPTGLVFTSPTISGTVATAGVYNITLGATNATGTDTKTLVLTVTTVTSSDDDDDDDDRAKGSGPVITLKRDDGLVPGQPFTLPATTSSGQAITWILVSGNATLNGNVLTPKNRGTVVVRAVVAGTTSKASNAVVEYEIEPKESTGGDKAPRSDRLSNLSSRLRVSDRDGSHAGIAGFVVNGSAPKSVLVRAVGPGLAAFGVSDAVSGADLELHDSSGRVIAENHGWKGDASISAAAARLGAFGLNASSRDSAVLVTLTPGAYTAKVGATGEGTALVEVYDATNTGAATTEQLINISTRGYVDAKGGNLIAGFVVAGSAPKRVLIRAVGPTLGSFGVADVIADPVLELVTASGVTIARNNDWQMPEASVNVAAASAADIQAAAKTAGAFALPTGSKDAALVVTLLPGSYTAVVTGANGSAGAALVEVFELPLQ